MSDLPTREEMMDDRPWIGDELEVVIVEAYAEGRLVDREAIDYEAAAGFWSDLASDVTDPDMEDFTYDLSKPGYAKKLTDLFLDAALGEET